MQFLGNFEKIMDEVVVPNVETKNFADQNRCDFSSTLPALGCQNFVHNLYLRFFKTEHIQNTDGAVGGVSHSIVQCRHRLAWLRTSRADGRSMLTGSLQQNFLITNRIHFQEQEGIFKGERVNFQNSFSSTVPPLFVLFESWRE